MAIDGVVLSYLTDHDIRSGTTLENKVAFRLHRWDLLDEMQYRVGKYRLDFAWPRHKIVLEADGPHHWRPDVAMKDAIRDSWLRNEGWLVFRVDEMSGGIEQQLARVADVLRRMQ